MTDDELHPRRADEALRIAQADLARMSRLAMLGELSATLAHELNQPLAAIVANCDASSRWQRATPPNLEQMSLAVERIRRDALRATAVLERVRAFVRNAAPDPTPVRLPEAVQEVVDMLSSEIHRNAIDLEMHIPMDLPEISGTRVELQQVFLNLFINAIESLAHERAGQPRKLSVECSRGRLDRTDMVFIAVQDSGAGFREADRDRLFDAFFTTKAEGLGMGLAISRSIIRRHGGDLRARNTPTGPRFEFYLRVGDESER